MYSSYYKDKNLPVRALSCVLVRSCRYISFISEIWLHKGRNFALLFYNLPSCRKVRVWRWASHCALSLITESEEQVDGRPSCKITHPLASMSFHNGAEKTVASAKRRVLRIFWRTKMAAKPCDCIRQLPSLFLFLKVQSWPSFFNTLWFSSFDISS